MMVDPLVKVTHDLSAHGWHVIRVPEDDEGPSLGYTIGLTETFGHPELVMMGLPTGTLHALLNELGDRIRAGERFEQGLPVRALSNGDLHCAMRTVHPRHFEAFVGQALRYYRSVPFRLLQCFWPDAEGRLPWQERFDPSLGRLQSLLYEG